MSENIDKKYLFTGANPVTGRIVTQDNAFIIKASDHATLPTLDFYYKECVRLGCDDLQLKGIVSLKERVKKWRADNYDKCKRADTSPEEGKHTVGQSQIKMKGGD